jgi:hypothetical protein
LTDLRYSDGIAAARTTIVLEANPTALQRRLPSGWELAPYSGDAIDDALRPAAGRPDMADGEDGVTFLCPDGSYR